MNTVSTTARWLLGCIVMLAVGMSAGRCGGEPPDAERYDWQPRDLVDVIGTHRGAHWWEVTAVEFAPDGKRVATGSGDHGLRIWDTETLRQRGAQLRLPGSVGAVSFSADGRQVVAAINILEHEGNFGEVRIYDYLDDKLTERTRLNGFNHLFAVRFSPDGKLLAIENRREVLVFDMIGGRPRQRYALRSTDNAWDLQFSADSRHIAAACGSNLLVWDVSGPKPLPLVDVKTKALSVAFAPDGRTLATGSFHQDEAVRIWDLKQLQQATANKTPPQPLMEKTPVAQGGIRSLQYSPDGKTLATATGTQDMIRLWRVTDRRIEPWADLKGHSAKVFQVAFSRDGSQLASVSSDHGLRLWQLGDEPGLSAISRDVDRRAGNWQVVRCLDNGQRLLLSGNRDALFDASTRELSPVVADSNRAKSAGLFSIPSSAHARMVSHGGPDRPVAHMSMDWLFGPGRDVIATRVSLLDETGRPFDPPRSGAGVWEAESGKWLRAIGPVKEGYWAIGPEGRQVVSLLPNAVELVNDSGLQVRTKWKLPEKTVPRLFFCDRETVVVAFDVLSDLGEPQVAVQPWKIDGNRLVIGQRWHIPRGNERSRLSLSRDHQVIAIGNRGKSIEVWKVEAAGGRRLGSLNAPDRQFFLNAVSPDGHLVATHAYGHLTENAVQVWDIAAGKMIHDWKLPGSSKTADFSGDGQFLFTANYNGTVYKFRVTNPHADTPFPVAENDDQPGGQLVKNPRVDAVAVKRLKALRAEYAAAKRKYEQARKTAKTSQDTARIIHELYPTIRFSARFLELADEVPGTTTERDALIWICRSSLIGGPNDRQFRLDQAKLYRRKRQAADRLLKHYADSPQLQPLVLSLAYTSNAEPGDVVRRLLQVTPDRRLQAECYLMLVRIIHRNTYSQYGRQRPMTAREIEVSRNLLGKVIEEYGDLKGFRRRAERQLKDVPAKLPEEDAQPGTY